MKWSADDDSMLRDFIQNVQEIYGKGKQDATKQWKWLEKYQKSDDLLRVCCMAMEANVSSEVTYYSSLTLKSKIVHELSKYQPHEHQQMFNFILGYIANYQPDPKITRECCIALASLVLQSSLWEHSFVPVIVPLSQIQTKADSAQSHFYVPKTMCLFLNEYCQMINRSGATVREVGMKTLKAKTAEILGLLEKLGDTFANDITSLDLVYETFWIMIKCAEFSPHTIMASSIFAHVIHTLVGNTSLSSCFYENCANCIIESLVIFNEDKSVNRMEYYNKFQQFSSMLLPRVESELASNNEEFLQCVIDIHRQLLVVFQNEIVYDAEVLESADRVQNQNNIFFQVVHRICSTHNQQFVYSLFDFWDNFIQQTVRDMHDDSVLAMIRSHASVFARQLYQTMQLSADVMNETLYSTDDYDTADFRDYSLTVIPLLFNVLDPKEYRIGITSVLANGQLGYAETEGALFYLYALIPVCNDWDHSMLVDILLKWSPDCPKMLLETTCKVYHELATPIVQKVAHKLDHIVNFLHRCMADEAILLAALTALICFYAKGFRHLKHKMEDTLKVISQALLLTNKYDLIDCMSNCCSCMFSQVPDDEFVPKVNQLCSTHMERVRMLLQQTAQMSEKSKVLSTVEFIASFFKFTTVPLQSDLQSLHPVVNDLISMGFVLLDASSCNEDVSEKVVRMMRYLLKIAGAKYPHGLQLTRKIIEYFNKSGRSCFLYGMGIFVEIFSSSPQHQGWVVEQFTTIASSALTILDKPQSNEQLSFLLEDFMRLCYKMFDHLALKFLHLPHCLPILMRSSQGLLCEHRKTFYSCFQLISAVLNAKYHNRDSDSPAVRQLVKDLYVKIYPPVIAVIVESIFSQKSFTSIECCGELLFLFFKFDDKSKQFLQQEMCKRVNSLNSTYIAEYLKKITTVSDERQASQITRRFAADI